MGHLTGTYLRRDDSVSQFFGVLIGWCHSNLVTVRAPFRLLRLFKSSPIWRKPGSATLSAKDWQHSVLQLIEGARCIFVMPDRTWGIRWEIGQILARQAWLEKTFFVVPPLQSPRERRRWLKTEDVVGLGRLGFPELYGTGGAVVYLSSLPTARRHQSFLVFDDYTLAELNRFLGFVHATAGGGESSVPYAVREAYPDAL